MANQSDETKLAVIQTEVSYMKGDVAEIKKLLQTGYVTKEEHEPIKKIVYGLVGLMLVSVVGAVMALVIKR